MCRIKQYICGGDEGECRVDLGEEYVAECSRKDDEIQFAHDITVILNNARLCDECREEKANPREFPTDVRGKMDGMDEVRWMTENMDILSVSKS